MFFKLAFFKSNNPGLLLPTYCWLPWKQIWELSHFAITFGIAWGFHAAVLYQLLKLLSAWGSGHGWATDLGVGNWGPRGEVSMLHVRGIWLLHGLKCNMVLSFSHFVGVLELKILYFRGKNYKGNTNWTCHIYSSFNENHANKIACVYCNHTPMIFNLPIRVAFLKWLHARQLWHTTCFWVAYKKYWKNIEK